MRAALQPLMLTLTLTLGLVACADGPADRNLALATSSQLELHESQVKDFIAAQSQASAAYARELDTVNADSARLHGAVDRQTQAWTLMTSKDLLSQAQLVTTVTPAAIVAATSTTTTPAAVLTDNGAGAALDGANKTLKALATAKPGALDELKQTFATFASVNSALSALQTKLAATTTTTAAAPKAATPAD